MIPASTSTCADNLHAAAQPTLEQRPDDTESDEPDSWFRPIWAEPEDDTAPSPPLPRASTEETWTPRPTTLRVGQGAGTPLLAPLAAAQDAVARLDAQAELLPPLLQTGLITRFAYAEASGLLVARGIVIHPLDLALRDSERLGRRDLLARSRRNQTADPEDSTGLAMDDKVRGALHLASLLQHLPTADDPLITTETAQARLGPLGPVAAFDPDRFQHWRTAHWLPTRRRTEEKSALLRAAGTALAWPARLVRLVRALHPR